jgi:predicted RNase H-like nuclease (RuvC/YqgF family)
MNNEVQVNRGQLIMAHTADEQKNHELNRINHALTFHNEELHKHNQNWRQVETTVNTWKEEICINQHRDQQAMNKKIATLEEQIRSQQETIEKLLTQQHPPTTPRTRSKQDNYTMKLEELMG